MNKIKRLFSGMINAVKKTVEAFPVTTIIVFILTFIITFFVIGVNLSREFEEFIAHILLVGSITAVGTWFSEAIFDNKKDLRKIIFYIISLGIAIIFDRIIDNPDVPDALGRWLFGYIIVCVLGTIYTLSKKSEKSFERYILNVLLNIGQACCIYWLIVLGFAFIYFIFLFLILNTIKFEIFLKVICLFAGFYYIPVLLKAFLAEDAEDTKFNRVVSLRVLLPLLLLSMLIIYMYIVKIFVVEAGVPENQLFMILSVIFAFAFPIYLINKNYVEENDFVAKVNRLIPYLYIPFIFLQIYAISVRISTYGITEPRYFAIVLIIFEIISIFLFIFKNSKYQKEITLLTLVISVIVMVSPFNFERVSILSQKAIVDKYVENNVEFDDLEEIDKRKFAGAYQFLEYKYEDYINSSLSQIEKEKLSSYRTYRYFYESEYDGGYDREYEQITRYMNFNKDLDNIDISKYSKVYDTSYYGSSSYNLSSSTLININYNGNDMIEVDLKDYIEELVKAEEISNATSNRVFKEMDFVKIDKNRDLYITNCSFEYDSNTGEISYINFNGYVFEK